MKRKKSLWYSYQNPDKWISKHREHSIYEPFKKGSLRYPYYDAPDLNNLQELITYCSYTFKEKTAFRYLDKSNDIQKSYIDFFEDVAALSLFLVKHGYNRTHIALLGENSYEWLVSFFAIVNSDNVVVPLDKESEKADISKIINKSDTTVLIHSDDYTEEAEANENIVLINMKDLAEIVCSHKTDKCKDLSFYDEISVDNEDVCAIFYTSGTTSEPKGVMLSHKNIVCDTIATSKSVRVADPSLLTLPLHHTYGFVASVTIPMLIGSSIFINSSTRHLMRDINYVKPEYMAVVPLIAEVMYKKIWENAKSSGKDKLLKKLIKISDSLCKVGIDLRRKLFSSVIDGFGGNLEILVIGGAAIDPAIVRCFNSFGIKALVGYGITECSPVVSTVRNKHYCPESVGTVHPGVNVRIFNGEIQVKGDTVFIGYYKNPEATAEAFDGEWFKTGDIGELKNGFLYITGRIKNLIILSNGENISPEELEQYLKTTISEITEIVVYADKGGISAEIFAEDGNIEKIKKKIFELNKNRPVYKQIKQVYFRDIEFEKTTTKKIKRSSLGENKNA